MIVKIAGRSIGIFNVKGEFYALRNLCPHQQAPLCEGRIVGTTLPSQPGEYILGREGEIIRCPWHAWEFDIKTGRSLFNPLRCRVRNYQVSIDTPETGSDDIRVERFPVSLQDATVVVHV
jgi:3-phenylpropionate/trans-cinnamate dioxygenase ferredoxin subunit